MPQNLAANSVPVVLASDQPNVPVAIMSGGAGGGPVTVADGGDVAEGATADVAVQGDNSGTLSAKLRGLLKYFAGFFATPGSAVPANAVQISGSDGTNARVLKTDTTGQAAINVSAWNGSANGVGNPVYVAPWTGSAFTTTLGAGSAIAGKVGIDQTTPGTTNKVSIGTDVLPAAAALADAASNPTTPMVGSNTLLWNGASWDRMRVSSIQGDMAAVAITTIATVYTPTSGKKFRLMGGFISVSAACSVLFEDNVGAGGTVFRTPQLLANTPYNFVVKGGQGYLSAAANNVLKGTASTGTVTITGTLYLCEE